jgi:hypothetical protein
MFTNNPRIVTNGLQLCVDANDVSSYPGSGTTWYDLSGNGWNFTLNGNVTLVGTQGKDAVFHTGGTSSDYIANSNFNYTSQDYTVMTATRYAGSPHKRVLNAYGNNWLLGHHSNGANKYYAEGWVNSVGPDDEYWRIYAGTGNILGDLYNFYSWGGGSAPLEVIGNTSGSAGPNGFMIGKYITGVTEMSVGEVGFVLLYNRILSTAELTQNFNTFRSRFGI